MNHKVHFLAVAVAVVALILIVFAVPLSFAGPRTIGVIENIDGIPFPKKDNTAVVTEKLAHADIYLHEPVLGKRLILTVTFTPHTIKQLHVGVRENAFWLSYQKMELYHASPASNHQPLTRTVSIPLTDKLQEVNRSVDLMFFAKTPQSTEDIDENIRDTTLWELHTITAQVQPTLPTLPQLKDYAKSILTRERAL